MRLRSLAVSVSVLSFSSRRMKSTLVTWRRGLPDTSPSHQRTSRNFRPRWFFLPFLPVPFKTDTFRRYPIRNRPLRNVCAPFFRIRQQFLALGKTIYFSHKIYARLATFLRCTRMQRKATQQIPSLNLPVHGNCLPFFLKCKALANSYIDNKLISI